MCKYFKTETEDHFLGMLLSEKNMGVQSPVVILQQANFYKYLFCACGKESSKDLIKVFSS